MEGLLNFVGCSALSLLKVSMLPMPSIEEIMVSEEFPQARGIQQQLDCLIRITK